MQITINLPDELAHKLQEKWGDISKIFFANIVLESFKEGLIDFDEFREMLSLKNDKDLKAFLAENIPLHSSGLLNLAGSCADIDFVIDDLESSEETDKNLIGVFDE